MDIQNFFITNPQDPFNDLQDEETSVTKPITIQVVQRKVRKYITSVEGLQHHGIDLPNFLKEMRKMCSCNGSLAPESNALVLKDQKPELVILQLQGNQKEELIQVLTQKYYIGKDMIVLRGL